MYSIGKSVSILVAAGAIAPALAEDRHRHPHHPPLEEVIISADPLGDVDSRFAAPAAVMDEKALRKASMRSIGEAVAEQLGVTSSDFGAGVGRPVIRGLGGGRVRVLEDGIGSMDVSTVSADHGVSTEPIFAEQIEILRGPATLLYGSSAAAGLVNIANGRILGDVPEKLAAEIYTHYDSASDGWLGAFDLDAALAEDIAVHVDGLKRDTGDIEIPGFAEADPDEDELPGSLPNSETETENISGGLSLIRDNGFIGFNVSRFENVYGVPGAHHHEEDHEEEDAGADEAEEEGGVNIDQEQTRVDLEGEIHLDTALLNRIKARWGYNDYQHAEIEGSGEIGTRFSNEEWEGRLEAILQPFGRWDGVIGVQLRDKEFAAVGEEAFVPPAERDSYAVFLFEKADFGDLHVDLGVRYEAQEAQSAAFVESPDHDLISVSGGAIYNLRAGLEMGFSTSRSERAPTIEELFSGGPHLATNSFEIGDAGLDEETSTNIDVFFRKTQGRYRFDFTVFYNAISDFVFLDSNDLNGDGIADRVEEDFLDSGAIVDEDEALLLVNHRQLDAEFWGFELEGRVTLIDDGRGVLDARVWTDYVDAELDDGRTVPRLPPLRIGAGLEWERGPAYAGLSVVHVTEPDDLAPLETDTDAYTMVNVHAGYTLSFAGIGDVTVFARGTNLADQTARRHTSFVKDLAPLPGVSGLVGLRARF